MVHATAALTAIGWLIAGASLHDVDHHGDRRADHHLPLRAGAGDPGGAGRGLRRAVPLGHHPERRRRHRAPGRGRHGRLRQDRHADPAGAAGRQCRRRSSRTCWRRPRGWRFRAAIRWPSRSRARRATARPTTARSRSRVRACAPLSTAARRGSAARRSAARRDRASLLRPSPARRSSPSPMPAARRLLAVRQTLRPDAVGGGDGAARARARSCHPVGRSAGRGRAGRRGARHRGTGWPASTRSRRSPIIEALKAPGPPRAHGRRRPQRRAGARGRACVAVADQRRRTSPRRRPTRISRRAARAGARRPRHCPARARA